ncbi:MAG: acyl carrier protein [Clostridia bacterium]|nr:acyl carrier protein [Clostridia bacterium]MDE7329449.1 acyl carrier protein [Clostridia bacterium]
MEEYMILNDVCRIVGEQLNKNAENMTAQTSFKEDLGVDSLDVVEIVMALEEFFNVEIDDDKVLQFNTIGDVVSYIESLNK